MADLKVLGTVALKGLLGEYEPQLDRSGLGMTAVWGPTGTVYERCRAGESYDLVIAVPDAITQMTSEGHVVPGTTVAVCKSLVGVAVRAGAPRPKLETVEDVKAALRAARRVAYTDPATKASSGLHVARLLEAWGMTEEINAKAKLGSGGPVAEFIASGEADLAIQQICEHKLVAGVDVAGPLPMAINAVTTLSVALGARAGQVEAARDALSWLGGPAARALLAKHGLFAMDEV